MALVISDLHKVLKKCLTVYFEAEQECYTAQALPLAYVFRSVRKNPNAITRAAEQGKNKVEIFWQNKHLVPVMISVTNAASQTRQKSPPH